MDLRQTPSRRARSASTATSLTSPKKLRSDSDPKHANPGATTPQHEDEITSPFLRLPAELRIQIYEYCLRASEPLVLAIPPNTIERRRHFDNDEDRGYPAVDPRFYWTRSGAPSADAASYQAAWDGAQDHLHLTPALLGTCKQIHKEARKILYSDNEIFMRANWGPKALQRMKQQTRSLIRRVTIEVPSHSDITDGFVDIVRLGLRYCWGLEDVSIIIKDYKIPVNASSASTAYVYGDPFRILRWLPQKTKVNIGGTDPPECVRRVIEKERWYMGALDKVSFGLPFPFALDMLCLSMEFCTEYTDDLLINRMNTCGGSTSFS